MLQRIREWITEKKWKQMKKSDWVVLALVGVLLLIVAMPMEKQSTEKTKIQDTKEEADETIEENLWQNAQTQEDYVSVMENRLKQILVDMEGVGNVQVMITIADYGEQVVEKDISEDTTTTTETDSAGGSRTVAEKNLSENTIYVDTGEETYPYIQKEKTPKIEGVVVVAEGGGNSAVVSDISDAVMALFQVDAHRIKVVKMCPREE